MGVEAQQWKLLIVDDEPAMAWFLADIAESEGYQIEIAESGDEGVSKIEQGGFHAVLTDYRMPGRNGLDLIRYTKERKPDLPIVMITGYATVQNTVEAFHLGVFDLLEKPFDLSIGRALLQRLKEALQQQQVLNNRLQGMQLNHDELPELVAERESMQQSVKMAKLLSRYSDPVLIYGERGSGRTVLARWVQVWMESASSSLYKIQASAHSLDEIEQLLISLDGGDVLLQQTETLTEPELARILLIQRELGGTVTATACLDQQGQLPLHLYHQFAGLVPVPPPHQREADLPVLLALWSEEARQRWGDEVRAWRAEGGGDEWLLEVTEVIDLVQLKQRFLQYLFGFSKEAGHTVSRSLDSMNRRGYSTCQCSLSDSEDLQLNTTPQTLAEDATLAEVERYWIGRSLERTSGNKTKAAEQLGINPSTLHRKLKSRP